jgi:hypothetical protein
MTNILEAIANINEHRHFEISSMYSGKNRVNNIGEALEYYVKDAFANTFNIKDEVVRDSILEQKFSWLGNQNNPPDSMIRGGDALEVKKTESANAGLALNSSYPKSTIKKDDPLIVPDFVICEEWEERDIIYCVGHTDSSRLKSLWMVYGSIYAARHETYKRIKDTISTGVNSIPNVEFAETTELGGVKRVDPLGITNLRIRGMWHILNPRKVFDYVHKNDKSNSFEFVCIVPLEKYNSFPAESKTKLESISNSDFSISEVKIKNPNNPANRIDCKLIKILVQK